MSLTSNFWSAASVDKNEYRSPIFEICYVWLCFYLMFSLAQQMLIIKFLSPSNPTVIPFEHHQLPRLTPPTALQSSLFPSQPHRGRSSELTSCGFAGAGIFWFYLVLIWIDLLIYPVDMWISWVTSLLLGCLNLATTNCLNTTLNNIPVDTDITIVSSVYQR